MGLPNRKITISGFFLVLLLFEKPELLPYLQHTFGLAAQRSSAATATNDSSAHKIPGRGHFTSAVEQMGWLMNARIED